MASHLGLAIDEIDCSLTELRNLNLIEPACLKGWLLKDLDGLDALDQLKVSAGLRSTKERYFPVARPQSAPRAASALLWLQLSAPMPRTQG